MAPFLLSAEVGKRKAYRRFARMNANQRSASKGIWKKAAARIRRVGEPFVVAGPAEQDAGDGIVLEDTSTPA